MNKAGVFFLSVLVSVQIAAQPAGLLKPASSFGNKDLNVQSLFHLQKNYLEKIYFSSVTSINELINGREYLPYYWRSGTNPLLFVNRNRTSTLFFRDMEIRGLSLQYDTYLDVVIYTDNSRIVNGQLARIALNRDNIKGFNLYFDYDSLNFRLFRFPAKYSDKMKDGFYEVAYDGRSQFLIKHRSALYNKEGLDKYAYTPENYVLSGDSWIKISSKKSLMKVFGDRGSEMNAVIHKSKIRVPKASKGQIVELLKYFDATDKNVK